MAFVPPDITSYDRTVSPRNITWYPSERSNVLAEIFDTSGKLVPPGTYGSQYKINDAWKGLCGEVAVDAILRGMGLGVSANDVVQSYMGSVSAEPNNTGVGQLAQLINNVYGAVAATDASNLYTSQWQLQAGQAANWGPRLRELLASYYILAAVQITGVSSNANGGTVAATANGIRDRQNALNAGQPSFDPTLPAPCDRSSGVVCHWVAITGISNEWEGGQGAEASPWNWLRIYNPFNNQPEYYYMEDFKNAWNVAGYAMMAISKSAIP